MQTDVSNREVESLLRDFDETARLARRFLADRYGEEGADALHRAARQHYQEIIPRVPRISGPRARVLNVFLRITAQEVAAYKAVKERGGTAAEAWEICHEALRLRMKRFPNWKRWALGRFMHSGITRRIAARRERRKKQTRFGDFAVRYLTGDGSDFDFGVDYLQCGNLELVKELGAEEFAPYVCMSDVVLSNDLGWGLVRTQTLADGFGYCDFRFKKDGETRITSKTSDVQETVERIQRRSDSA